MRMQLVSKECGFAMGARRYKLSIQGALCKRSRDEDKCLRECRTK